jgi:hypothetical protein
LKVDEARRQPRYSRTNGEAGMGKARTTFVTLTAIAVLAMVWVVVGAKRHQGRGPVPDARTMVDLKLGAATFRVPAAAVISYGNPKDPFKEGAIMMALHWPGLAPDIQSLRTDITKRPATNTMLVWIHLNDPWHHPYEENFEDSKYGEWKKVTGSPGIPVLQGWTAYRHGAMTYAYYYKRDSKEEPDATVVCNTTPKLIGRKETESTWGCDVRIWVGQGISTKASVNGQLFVDHGLEIIFAIQKLLKESRSP